MMFSKNIKYIAPILLIGVFLGIYLYKSKENRPVRILPFYGPIHVDKKDDTIHHRIRSFHFTNQFGADITNKTVKGRIFIVDYFFTTCKSICPKMSKQMERVQDAFRDDPDVLILSHTVDPEEDSVEVLAAYADKHKAIKGKWHFLTGDKPALYEQARKSYLLDAEEGNGGEEDFIHTDKFALVDWNMHIRGYYSGIDSAEVDKLIVDIRILQEEKAWKHE
ncbi:MAG: BsSco [Bacteroidetes bacterium]|jgi:protein SCO1/2|nr:BsSco [Bacteroidota bacterium]